MYIDIWFFSHNYYSHINILISGDLPDNVSHKKIYTIHFNAIMALVPKYYWNMTIILMKDTASFRSSTSLVWEFSFFFAFFCFVTENTENMAIKHKRNTCLRDSKVFLIVTAIVYIIIENNYNDCFTTER